MEEAYQIRKNLVEDQEDLKEEIEIHLLSSLNNLANALKENEEYEESEKIYQQVIEKSKSLFSQNRIENKDYSIHLNNYAVLKIKKGDLDQSINILEERFAKKKKKTILKFHFFFYNFFPV